MAPGTKATTPQMTAFEGKAGTAAGTITTSMNKMLGELSILDASKGAFASAFQITKSIVERETKNLSNALHGIAIDVGTAAKEYEKSDQEQEAAIKKAEQKATGITDALVKR